jgi:steroid 5-alpha reductase family enzyme
MKNDFSRGASFCIVLAVYVVAALAGFATWHLASPAMPALWALLLADVVATLVTWAFGLLFSNVSVYDPYWSVLPPVMFTAWAVHCGSRSLPAILLLAAVWYWGIRLTANWAVTFKGLAHEDWRYTRYRQMQAPFLFQLTNLFGLNMVPTLVVFLAMLPGFGILESGVGANLLTWLGFAMCVSSATIQLVADTQSRRFRAAHPGEVCELGLWRRGRHPNYFGEVQFWWGIWVMYVSLVGFSVDAWYIAGPLAMTALFLFISIPMMELRQLERKPGYAGYRRRTRILI